MALSLLFYIVITIYMCILVEFILLLAEKIVTSHDQQKLVAALLKCFILAIMKLYNFTMTADARLVY